MSLGERMTTFPRCSMSSRRTCFYLSSNKVENKRKEKEGKRCPWRQTKENLLWNWNFYETAGVVIKKKQKKEAAEKGKTSREEKQVLGSTIPIHLGSYFFHRSFFCSLCRGNMKRDSRSWDEQEERFFMFPLLFGEISVARSNLLHDAQFSCRLHFFWQFACLFRRDNFNLSEAFALGWLFFVLGRAATWRIVSK